MSISKTLRQHFGFLEKEYGLKTASIPSDKWDRQWVPSVGYANDTTGVFAQYDVRDAYLDVTIHHLESGQFPTRADRVATSQGYPLNSIIYLDEPLGLIRSWHDESSKDADQGSSFDDYVARAAAQLKAYADDLLRGDFRRAAQIADATEKIMANRLGVRK